MSSNPTSSYESLLVDTDILVYTLTEESPSFIHARQRLLELQEGGCSLWICPQNIRELVAIMTRPNYLAHPLSKEALLDATLYYYQHYSFASETPAVSLRLLNLVRTAPVSGRRIFDVNLVATALEHGIDGILTNNGRHFALFAGLLHIEPL
jgi:predicted nucleic acid-binding protein